MAKSILSASVTLDSLLTDGEIDDLRGATKRSACNDLWKFCNHLGISTTTTDADGKRDQLKRKMAVKRANLEAPAPVPVQNAVPVMQRRASARVTPTKELPTAVPYEGSQQEAVVRTIVSSIIAQKDSWKSGEVTEGNIKSWVTFMAEDMVQYKVECKGVTSYTSTLGCLPKEAKLLSTTLDAKAVAEKFLLRHRTGTQASWTPGNLARLVLSRFHSQQQFESLTFGLPQNREALDGPGSCLC